MSVQAGGKVEFASADAIFERNKAGGARNGVRLGSGEGERPSSQAAEAADAAPHVRQSQDYVGKDEYGVEKLTLRERFVTASTLLFLVLLATLSLPNRAGANPQVAYTAVVGGAVWVVGVLGCAFARSREVRDSFVDVTSVVFVVLAAWQAATAGFNVLPEKMFPAPGIVFAQIVADAAKIWEGIVSSLGIIGQGFLLGTACALVIGLALGYHARSARNTAKVVSFLSAIPPIVYIPYGIALLPTFRASSVMVIFLATFWPVLTGTLAGVSGVDKRILNSARVLNVGTVKTLLRVVLPSALPLIFNGLNIALCLSFILLTSAEMIGGSTGMGYYVKYYSDFGDYTRILAGIIVIGVVITVISLLLNKLEQYLTRWQ